MNPIPYLTLATPPAAEPLTLAEAKLFLRVDGSSEDVLISELIMIARQRAEEYLRRSLIIQTWLLVYDDYAPTETPLPRGPVDTIVSVKRIDRTGSEIIVDSDFYYLNAARDTLVFSAVPIAHRVEIRYTTGFGDAPDIPAPIKQGIRGHVVALYENREGSSTIPASSIYLYEPFRIMRLA